MTHPTPFRAQRLLLRAVPALALLAPAAHAQPIRSLVPESHTRVQGDAVNVRLVAQDPGDPAADAAPVP